MITAQLLYQNHYFDSQIIWLKSHINLNAHFGMHTYTCGHEHLSEFSVESVPEILTQHVSHTINLF